MMRDKKFAGVNGKGYYIALALCALAIGVSGYLYYANDEQTEEKTLELPPQVTEPAQAGDVAAAVIKPEGEGTVPAPTGKPENPTQPPETTPPVTVARKPMKTAAPVDGQTVGEYAMECLSYNPTTRDWRVHNGVDIAAQPGTPVLAAAAGTVYTVYEDETMGMTVVVRHEEGYVSCYASLAPEVTVAPGDRVVLGQQLGAVGNTALLETALGDHVHFSVTRNGEPMDPAEFLSLS